MLLGSYLASEYGRTIMYGKKVFELGAGTCMLSIICANDLCVAGIVDTDGDEVVVDAIKTNIFLNGLDTDDSSGCPVRTAALRWGWPIDAATFSEDYGMEAPDVLLGADVCEWRARGINQTSANTATKPIRIIIQADSGMNQSPLATAPTLPSFTPT